MKLTKEQVKMLEKRKKDKKDEANVWLIFGIIGILIMLLVNFIIGFLFVIVATWQKNSTKKDLEDIEFKLAGEHKSSHKSYKNFDITTSNLINAISFGVLLAVLFIPFAILVASFFQGVPAESFWFIVAFLSINLFFIIVAFMLMIKEIRKYKIAKIKSV